ncbi:MAG TPA: DUF349 domain-containing protein [Frankiaceae bacterium]|nr:DUF349 domain-containing protein [Frankiaceae bacterium]
MSDGRSTLWGRIADDGTVYVRTGSGERAVGSWRAGSPEEGLAHFARRYDELVTGVELLERRLSTETVDAQGVRASAGRLRDSLATANVVGDLAALDRRLAAVQAAAEERLAQVAAARAERAAAAAGVKRELAEEAERLATSTDWKAAGDRFRGLAEQWRGITGVDRRTDSELWRRVAAAREEFGRRRAAHFAALDEQRAAARARKEELVAEAERLAGSSDWGATAGRFKALMAEWKAAGRASREADDALWARFRAAQDGFFSRRNAVHAERDAQYRGNQARKERLLAEAEALDVDADPAAAGRRLREIQERWETVGRVPREAMAPLERRLAAVEERVRSAAEARWHRPDPQASPLVTRLRESVAKLEAKVEQARAAGRAEEAAEAEAALATQREWLAQAARSAR